MAAVEVLDELPVEDGGHRLDRLELVPDGLDMLGLEDLGLAGRLVGRIGEAIPAAEDHIDRVRQADELLDGHGAVLGPLSQADLPHLGQRPDGAGQTLADGEEAGQERRGYGADAGNENAEPAAGRRDIASSQNCGHVIPFQAVRASAEGVPPGAR